MTGKIADIINNRKKRKFKKEIYLKKAGENRASW